MAPFPEETEEHRVVDEEGGEVEEYSRDTGAERSNITYRITEFVWFVVGVIEAIIALRVLLKLLAANPANGFANFIYNISYPFVAPFFGLIGTPSADGSVLEIPSLIAMLVYFLIGWGIVTLIRILLSPTHVRHTRTVHRA